MVGLSFLSSAGRSEVEIFGLESGSDQREREGSADATSGGDSGEVQSAATYGSIRSTEIKEAGRSMFLSLTSLSEMFRGDLDILANSSS